MELNSIQNYLQRDLGIAAEAAPAEIPAAPFFIRKQFDFWKISVFDKELCMLISKAENFSRHKFQEILSAAAFFQSRENMLPVFVFSAMSKQERLELIRQKIAFMVPDTQMYIPYIGLDLSDHIPMISAPVSKALRPAAQALIIEQLLTGKLNGLTVNQAAKVMGYTAMGTLRAANQLNELGICHIEYDGYRKVLHFPPDRKNLWEAAEKHLLNPVKKTYSVEDDSALSPYPLAGEFILRKYSDLSVSRKTYALHQKEFSQLVKEKKIHLAFAKETGCADIQIWNYTLPVWQGEVDPISLELSFKDSNDARIKIALLSMKEQFKW